MRKYGRGSTIGHSAFSFMTTYMSNLCRFLYHFVKNMRLISKLKIHKYMIISHYHVGYLLNVKEEIYKQLHSFQSLYCTNALENGDLDLHFNLDLTFCLGSSLFPNKQFNSFFTVHTKIDTMYLGLCPNLLTLSFCVTLNFYYFPNYFHLSLQHCKLKSVKIRNTIFHVVRL